MRVADLTQSEFEAHLAGDGIGLDFGAARARIRADSTGLGAAMSLVYGRFPLEDASGFFDVSLRMRPARALRRYIRPQVELVVDGKTLFAPFPHDTQLPLLEWGMNYLMA